MQCMVTYPHFHFLLTLQTIVLICVIVTIFLFDFFLFFFTRVVVFITNIWYAWKIHQHELLNRNLNIPRICTHFSHAYHATDLYSFHLCIFVDFCSAIGIDISHYIYLCLYVVRHVMCSKCRWMGDKGTNTFSDLQWHWVLSDRKWEREVDEQNWER